MSSRFTLARKLWAGSGPALNGVATGALNVARCFDSGNAARPVDLRRFHCISKKTAVISLISWIEADAAPSADQTRRRTIQFLGPPFLVIEYRKNLSLDSLVSEQHSAIYQARPEALEAGSQRIGQVDVAESKGNRLLQLGKCLLKVTWHKRAAVDRAVPRDIGTYFCQRAAPPSFFVVVSHAINGGMSLVCRARLGKSGEGIADHQLPVNQLAGERKIDRTPTFVGSTLDHHTRNLEVEQFGHDKELLQKPAGRRYRPYVMTHAPEQTRFLQSRPVLGPKEIAKRQNGCGKKLHRLIPKHRWTTGLPYGRCHRCF